METSVLLLFFGLVQNSDKSNKDESIDPDSTTKGALEKDDKDRSKYSPGKNKGSRQRRSSSRQSSGRNKKNTKEREEHPDKKVRRININIFKEEKITIFVISG